MVENMCHRSGTLSPACFLVVLVGRRFSRAFRVNRYSLKLVNFPLWIQWLLTGCADTHVTDRPWSVASFHHSRCTAARSKLGTNFRFPQPTVLPLQVIASLSMWSTAPQCVSEDQTWLHMVLMSPCLASS